MAQLEGELLVYVAETDAFVRVRKSDVSREFRSL